MAHGKLGIADGAINITEKEEIKTRKRCAQPHATAREKRLEREVQHLRKEISGYSALERVVQAMAAKGGMDYDTIAKETLPNLATESEALSRDNDGGCQDVSEQDNIDGRDYTDNEDEENDEYNYDNQGYNENEDDGDIDYNHRQDFDDDYNLWRWLFILLTGDHMPLMKIGAALWSYIRLWALSHMITSILVKYFHLNI